ncbi:hypothetical protein GPX89_27920 [Nocardia sp. ET3-3]|uniref:Uncharacterized protein n=1 Tax=Nocardia terrae TaxID=2675851 RepID=A0A7K1V3J1_9NOCA|nr:hypothetical protein [Nocardia terrae]MVU81062.1 hypothetical protein [Nocardia terrae]
MGEQIPEEPPTSERRHRIAKAARDKATQLPRENDEDRSPADPHDWTDEWDRARWAP